MYPNLEQEVGLSEELGRGGRKLRIKRYEWMAMKGVIVSLAHPSA